MIAQLKPLNSADAAMVRKRKRKKKKNNKRKDEEKDDVSKAIDTDRARQAKRKKEGVDDGPFQTKKRTDKGDGPNAIGSDPWMYAEDDDTFKVVSKEEVHQKIVAYDWRKGKIPKTPVSADYIATLDQAQQQYYADLPGPAKG